MKKDKHSQLLRCFFVVFLKSQKGVQNGLLWIMFANISSTFSYSTILLKLYRQFKRNRLAYIELWGVFKGVFFFFFKEMFISASSMSVSLSSSCSHTKSKCQLLLWDQVLLITNSALENIRAFLTFVNRSISGTNK